MWSRWFFLGQQEVFEILRADLGPTSLRGNEGAGRAVLNRAHCGQSQLTTVVSDMPVRFAEFCLRPLPTSHGRLEHANQQG